MLKFILFILLAISAAAQSPRLRSVEVITEPGASVWLDGILRGVADENGKLVLSPVSAGNHTIRIRAFGFKEISRRFGPSESALRMSLTKTFDRAEIAYQKAEKLVAEDKDQAIILYREALRLNPTYSQAQIGLARALADIGEYKEALSMIRMARKSKPSFAEVSAVEGRIFKSEGEIDKAISSFERAIREGSGFQPEAYTGLGLIYSDEAETARARADYDEEKLYYEEAAGYFEKAIDQLSGSEPVVYLLLGDIYERMDQKAKAIAIYQRFLRDLPDHEEKTAVESFIEQLQKPAEF